ncbi:helix-turn-helix domain-containing protein [Phaeovibrio sulfidiphilus]|uniref:Helix-turn-helix domain-containing protein n=1 Tax=Phaeovibrio sulfidiphilus TaxID=1220600 RepID=A0A8J6YH05_9PROT|nr:helix-turn-helix transcriptional regulator [Phaeovibrio sulfidiphilus]MBE1236126.1 helix-turn-helix domain-containing protein [Phaeovibrio sulfidiphilus]
MTGPTAPARTRPELAEFLRQHRESLSPEAVGLPAGSRRRTPGLRREEVAALTGVGQTWYTWLEQGRDIRVSTDVLDRLSRLFRLDGAGRRHLYALARQHPPMEDGRTVCTVPPLVHRLLADLPLRPAYVLNLRWDVLAWNPPADRVFRFSARPAPERNLLQMLFLDPATRQLFHDQARQIPGLVGSFRRDCARAPRDEAIRALVADLENRAPEFRTLWTHQDPQPCTGVRDLDIPGLGVVSFEHTTLILDEDRHLRLVYYAARPDTPAGTAFGTWLQTQ